MIKTATRMVTIAQYVHAIKMAKEHLDHTFKVGFSSWWPTSGREIIRQFGEYVQNAINIRGGLKFTEISPGRMRKYHERGRALVVLPGCRWCGTTIPLERFNPNSPSLWFCSDGCRRDCYH